MIIVELLWTKVEARAIGGIAKVFKRGEAKNSPLESGKSGNAEENAKAKESANAEEKKTDAQKSVEGVQGDSSEKNRQNN